MADELNRPYIGYRSAGRRPESQQDRRAAADAPLSVLRGMASGVLGAPGDIESLIRMLPGLSERTVLPTSEDVERRLPMRELNQTPTGRAFTTAGQIGGGFYTGPGSPLRAIAQAPQLAQSLAPAAGAMAMRAAEIGGMPVHGLGVVKPKGGNWLAGSVENALEPMRRYKTGSAADRESELLAEIEEATRMGASGYLNAATSDLQRLKNDTAVDKWLETKLGKYIKNEMATPDDPLRALAERGITHAEIRPTGYNVAIARAKAGFPEEGMATSPIAKNWEDRADTFVNQLQASDLTGHYPETVSANPWLLKVPPDTHVNELLSGAEQDLGFNHLVDELRNAVNPESGLPANLRLKYSDLDKVTVPQAVERVAKINEWREAQQAEANMARAMGPATQVVKEYPEQGMKWVELRQPKDLPEGWATTTDRFGKEQWVNPEGKLQEVNVDPRQSALEDALKYEGETMGHCVGGYCPDVVEGRSRIFSLRDEKGRPHVTIETAPSGSNSIKSLQEGSPQMFDIVQIKGKGNKAPKEDYLPAVQDFVRSGNFGQIGDLQNTGLVQLPDKRLLTKDQFDEGIQRMTGEGEPSINAEWFQRQIKNDASWWENAKDAFEGFSSGGQVRGYAEGGMVNGSLAGSNIYNSDAMQNPAMAYKFSDGGFAGSVPAYAEGGMVGDANFPTDDYNEARIDNIVGELHAMNAG